MFTISSSLGNNKTVSISIYDISGRLVANEISNSKNTILNVSDFQDGLYLLKLVFDNKSISQKFVVKH